MALFSQISYINIIQVGAQIFCN